MRHAGAGPSTRAVHAGEPEAQPGAPVVNPIVLSTTYHSHAAGEGEVLYQRYLNGPNQLLLAERLAALEGAEDALPLASGMAALACAILSVARTGDHIVATDAVYGGTRALLATELSRLGIATTFVDFFAPGWEAAFRPETRVVLGETPSNPLLRVMDLPAVSAEARRRGAVFILDATFASPHNLRGLEHGADLVMHSGTKYLGGHSDVTAGVLAGSRERIQAARERARVWGPLLDAHGAWLLERGIKTLAVRMERHNANGLAVARWAEGHPGIERVHYPGLPSHPDHARARSLLSGFGGMVGIEVRGGGEAATRFVAGLRLAKVAPSLGGVETLVSEPRHTSHAAMGPEARAASGIRDGFVRLSLGIEDPEDLIADLAGALEAAGGERSAAD